MNSLTQEQVSECEAGCKNFMCGSVGHIKECANYKDSMQEMIDIKDSRIDELEKQLAESVPKSEIKNLGEMWPIFLYWVNDYVGENTNKFGSISYSREDMRYAFQAGYELMQEKAK
jgi:hypothetical protein